MDGADAFADRFLLMDHFTNDQGVETFGIQLDAANQDINLVLTPEPATLALLALGMVAILRRRQRKT